MVHCSFCNSRVEADPNTRVGQLSWCPHCRRVFTAPVFLAPGWIAGVLLVLAINSQLW